ncbi:MAG: serine/threonine protein kinase, partial [Polyangiaceae bacterium]|nr:serine/threonine protein kinase [Polyangiaceae bacterium]
MTRASFTSNHETGLLLGRYRIVKQLAEGGMGKVYLARTEGAEGFTKPVVVKRMKPELRRIDDGARLFTREAKILSKMQHPNVLNIIDFGVEEGAYVMVLDYVHGFSLQPWLDYRYKTQRHLPVNFCLYIVRRVLSALHYAHHFDAGDGKENAIVHRDISPDNVLVSRDGHVHLLDFGIASMSGGEGQSTKSGTFRGKLSYSAPETLEGVPASPLSDQYSVAILLRELLTFDVPFLAESMAVSVQKMVNDVPLLASEYREGLPEGLDAAIARALEKKPQARFASALDFSRELRQFQTEEDEDVFRALIKEVREDFDALPSLLEIEGLKERQAALDDSNPSFSEVESQGAASGRVSQSQPGGSQLRRKGELAAGAVTFTGRSPEGQAGGAAAEASSAQEDWNQGRGLV